MAVVETALAQIEAENALEGAIKLKEISYIRAEGHLHTSGHASPVDLRAFANSMQPRWLVPIHGVAWDTEAEGFPRIRRLTDGESMTLLADE
jgi:mRNA degradation ribonuclease J1/J2